MDGTARPPDRLEPAAWAWWYVARVRCLEGRVVIDVCRVVDGRIVEHWEVPDRFAALAQTGVLDQWAAW